MIHTIENHSQSDVYDKVSLLWKFMKPISFALIGKEINFAKLDPQIVAYGVVIIVASSIVSTYKHQSFQMPHSEMFFFNI